MPSARPRPLQIACTLLAVLAATMAAATFSPVTAAAHPSADQKGPAVPDLLKLAGGYLTQYAQNLNAVAADEEFLQYDTSSGRMQTPKRVNSVIVLLGQSDGTILDFRDVVAIDNVPVRPKDDRLFTLFTTPSAASLTNAQTMTDDAVRGYASPNLHLLDRPTSAIDCLRPENQNRFTYKADGLKNMNGTQVAVLKFTEKGSGYLMTGASAIGRFWIDPGTGAVQQSELGFSMKAGSATTTVKFTNQAPLGLLLPSEFFEQVGASGGGSGMSDMGGATAGGASAHESYEGRATYSNYRQAKVEFAK